MIWTQVSVIQSLHFQWWYLEVEREQLAQDHLMSKNLIGTEAISFSHTTSFNWENWGNPGDTLL